MFSCALTSVYSIRKLEVCIINWNCSRRGSLKMLELFYLVSLVKFLLKTVVLKSSLAFPVTALA